MSVLEIVAAVLLSSGSLMVLWAIRLFDREPQEPVSRPTRYRLRTVEPEPDEVVLRRAA